MLILVNEKARSWKLIYRKYYDIKKKRRTKCTNAVVIQNDLSSINKTSMVNIYIKCANFMCTAATLHILVAVITFICRFNITCDFIKLFNNF